MPTYDTTDDLRDDLRDDIRGPVAARIERWTPGDRIDELEALFDEYLDWSLRHLGRSPLDVQPTARAERGDLAASYARPHAMITARIGDDLVGMAGLRRTRDRIGEITRCYARPAARGHAIGRRLVAVALDVARSQDLAAVELETFPAVMVAAAGLYRSLGFAPVAEQDYDGITTPAVRMRLRLGDRSTAPHLR